VSVAKETELGDVETRDGENVVNVEVLEGITGRDLFFDDGTVVTLGTRGVGNNDDGEILTALFVDVLSTTETGPLTNGVTAELTNSFFDLLVSLTFRRVALVREIEAISSASFKAGVKYKACSLNET